MLPSVILSSFLRETTQVKVSQTSGVNTQIRFIEGLVFFVVVFVVVVVVVFVFHNHYTRIDLAFYNTSIKSLGLVIRKATNHRVEFRKPINANPGLKKNISENLTEKLQN